MNHYANLQHLRVFFILLVIVMLTAGNSLVIAYDSQVEMALDEEMQRMINDSLLGNMDVVCTVIDEQSNLLQNVSLTLNIAKTNEFLTETRSIDNSFELDYDDVTSVYLLLSKTGYYKKELMFYPKEIDPAITIELVSVGQPVGLKETKVFLSYSPTGLSQIVSVASNGLSQLLIEPSVNIASGGTNLLQHGLYLTAMTNESGMFLRQIWRDTEVPETVQLHMFNGNDGFVLFDCVEQNPQKAYERMKIAPDTGYESSMVLTQGVQKIYFFCKVGERFGKGYISPIVSIEAGETIESPLRLLLQTQTGSGTNVTGDGLD